MLYATDINTDGNKLDSKKDGFWVGLSTDDVINLKHQGVGLKMNSPLRLCEQPLIGAALAEKTENEFCLIYLGVIVSTFGSRTISSL